MPTVTLLAHTPNPEKTVASAAKLCYSSSNILDLYDGLTQEKAADFVEMLSEIGHESPIEHASFTFGIEGVSRAFVTPPEVAADPVALEAYEESMRLAQESYDKIAEILTQKHTAAFIAEGKDEKTAARLASKKAIEDARFVLPNACETKMVVTMNARSLHNFFRHRCCNRAQWEIREVANQMLRLVSDVAPELFKKAGPPCLTGPCPEGKMTCGKAKEVKKF